MSTARIESISFLVSLMVATAIAGCAGDGGLGAVCDATGDCADGLQCLRNVCIARCERAPDCGDGYACRSDGICEPAQGEPNSVCTSETDCAAGLACQLEPADLNGDGALGGTCKKEISGHAFGAACTLDRHCRTGTCALGRCVDVCAEDRDCVRGNVCLRIPRVEAEGATFRGCLPERATVSWDIPISAPSADVLVPVPETSRGLALTMTVQYTTERVGATRVSAPESAGGAVLFDHGSETNALRHKAEAGVSVVQIPSSSASKIVEGAYRFSVSSLRPNGMTGSATPRVRASVAIGRPSIPERSIRPTLDLHFHFVDLSDHPCKRRFPGGSTLDAKTFQNSDELDEYLAELAAILPDLAFSAQSFDNLPAKNVRDSINTKPDPDDAPQVAPLLSKGKYATGINVFFVRSLSPAGTRAYGPTPGPTGVRGTNASGIILSTEQLCYMTWRDLARATAHQVARYLGLYPNLDAEGRADPIDDSGIDARNLMFFSDQGGTTLTTGQRDILVASPVLR